MQKVLAAAVIVLIVVGCATRPGMDSMDHSRSLDRDYDEVWDSLVQHLSGTDFRIKSIARDSGVIYAERQRFDDDLADCGTRGLASSSGRQVAFNVFVVESGGLTTVTINADFTESRYLEHSRWNRECISTGVMEDSILESIS